MLGRRQELALGQGAVVPASAILLVGALLPLAVGGFDGSLSIMEDADLCVRMHVKGRGRYRGRVKLLDRVVTTSGRRIEQLGNFKATCIHVLIACSWNFGVGPEKLRKLYDWCYRDVR